MKNKIDYQFEVLEADHPDAIVPTPQVLIFQLDINTKRIEVYFMENSAVAIDEGVVTSGMGTLNLWYTIEQPVELVAASLSLRKSFTLSPIVRD